MKNPLQIAAVLLFFAAFSASADTETILSEDFSHVYNNNWASTSYLGAKTSEDDYAFDSGTWRVYYVAQTPYAVRLGLTSNFGYLISPVVELTNFVDSASVKVSFRACRANASNSSGQIRVTLLDENGNSLNQEFTTGALDLFTTSATEMPDSYANNSAGDSIEGVFTDVPARFKIKFRSFNDGRDGIDSIRVVQTLVGNPLSCPSSLTVSGDPGVNSFTATWNGDAEATGYAVELYRIENGEEVLVETTDVPATSCEFTGLLSSTAYRYRVRAYDDTKTHRNTDWSAMSSDIVTAQASVTVEFSYAEGNAVTDPVYPKFTKTITVSATVDGTPSSVTGYFFEPGFTPSVAPSFSNGVFSWIPEDADAGDHEVSFTTQDGDGNPFATEIPVEFTVLERPVLAAVEPVISGVNCKGFDVDWESDQLRAASYTLKAWSHSYYPNTSSDYEPYLADNYFADPLGWSKSGCEWDTNYAECPIKMWNGSWVMSKLYDAPVTRMKYNTRKFQTSSPACVLYASTGGTADGDWVQVSSVDPTAGQKAINFDESLGYRRFKWVLTTGGGTGRLGSFTATYAGAGAVNHMLCDESDISLDVDTMHVDIPCPHQAMDVFLDFTVVGDSGETATYMRRRIAVPASPASVITVY